MATGPIGSRFNQGQDELPVAIDLDSLLAVPIEFDEVIDPKGTRKWIVAGLHGLPKNKSGRVVDGW